jgi:parallel beta-helix repeat protein
MFTTRQRKTKGTACTLKNTLATAGLLLGLVLASPAVAVQCGDTIGPNVSVTLSESLICDSTTNYVALTIIGPAEVHLNGFTIQCHDTNQDGVVPTSGLFLDGHNAQVHGSGIVKDCFVGVAVSGEGRHLVKNVETQNNREMGIAVLSAKNTLRGNKASTSRYGFVVGLSSDSNTLIENTAAGNKVGFIIDGYKQQLRRNVADTNVEDGFRIYDDKHTLIGNRAERNSVNGFAVQEAGIEITLRKNVASNNGQDGFQISGQGHKLIENEASANRGNGIQVHEANHIKLMNNVALANNQDHSLDAFDLADEIPNCDTNTWKQNTFGTANQPCIQ